MMMKWLQVTMQIYVATYVRNKAIGLTLRILYNCMDSFNIMQLCICICKAIHFIVNISLDYSYVYVFHMQLCIRMYLQKFCSYVVDNGFASIFAYICKLRPSKFDWFILIFTYVPHFQYHHSVQNSLLRSY